MRVCTSGAPAVPTMHPIVFLVPVTLVFPGDAHVFWGERARELRLDELLRPLLPREVLAATEHVRLSGGNCSRHLDAYRRAIARRDDWAVKMLDSSSKMPTGLMQGNLIELGMFDQCVDVAEDEIRGKHCMYSLDPGSDENALPLNPTLSICLPASCTEDDVDRLVNETILTSTELRAPGVKVGKVNCMTIEPKSISLGPIVFLCLLGCYITFLCFCTYCDVISSRDGNKWINPRLEENLVKFSMLRSVKAIFNLENRQDSLPVIHGIRVLSNMGVLLLHVYLFQLLGLNSNVFFLQKWYSQLGTMIPLVCLYCVDTFFALSGFLTSYGFFKKMQQGNQPSIFRYYLHRYLRLSLPMLMIVFLTIVLMPFLNFGPRYDFITGVLTKGCQSKWWSYFFYVHNYVEKDDMCLVHLWSLAVDMQLFWISPLIFYPLYVNRKLGLNILTGFFLISVISAAAIVWMNNYSAIYVDRELAIFRVVKSMTDIYLSTYTRASPWFLGAAFGYEVAQKNIKPNKALLCLGWFLALAAFIFSIWGIRTFTTADYEYNAIWEIIFAALSKPIWAFGICWIIYASANNFGGLISTVLSSRLFLPLSRLAYGIYLSHVALPIMKLATTRTQNYFHELFLLFSFVDIVPTSVVFGFFFSVLFEMPMFALEDLLFRRQSKQVCDRKKGE